MRVLSQAGHPTSWGPAQQGEWQEAASPPLPAAWWGGPGLASGQGAGSRPPLGHSWRHHKVNPSRSQGVCKLPAPKTSAKGGTPAEVMGKQHGALQTPWRHRSPCEAARPCSPQHHALTHGRRGPRHPETVSLQVGDVLLSQPEGGAGPCSVCLIGHAALLRTSPWLSPVLAGSPGPLLADGAFIQASLNFSP